MVYKSVFFSVTPLRILKLPFGFSTVFFFPLLYFSRKVGKSLFLCDPEKKLLHCAFGFGVVFIDLLKMEKVTNSDLKSSVNGGVVDVYGEDSATIEHNITPWSLSVSR